MIIEKSSLFGDISPALAGRIGQSLVEEQFEPGAHVFNQGQPAENLYILVEGRVRLTVGQTGSVTLVVSNAGDAFGWSSLLGRNYTATAECLVPVRAARIARTAVESILQEDPASGLALYRRLAHLIADRLENCFRLMPGAHGERHAPPGG